MSAAFSIRAATATDAAQLLEIYRPAVETSATSFELAVPSESEFADRIEHSLEKWAWLVAEVDGAPIGYAYGTAHRARPAYDYSVETSAYVDRKHHRQGVARALYEELFTRLRELRFESAFAGVALPNDASVAFHQSLGFAAIGVFPKVGYKFGRWHDVAWFYRALGGRAEP